MRTGIVTDNRSTGWKVPLLFCGVILSVVCLVGLLRGKPEPPAVPGPLLNQARAITINLDADAEGKEWKARIASAASGFATAADKDGRLKNLIETSIESGRFDAACTAAVLVRDDTLRDALLARILDAACAQCATLPWGVLAAHGMGDAETKASAHSALTRQWERCHEKNE